MSTFTAGQIPPASLFERLVPLYVRKQTTETISSNATMQNDDEIVLAVSANAEYEFFLSVLYNTGTTPDIKFQWTWPTGTTMFWGATGIAVAGSGLSQFANTESTMQSFEGFAGDLRVMMYGVVIVGSIAGNLQLQWAQNTSTASNTSVKAGSYLRMLRVV